jgi:HEAT repeat protein
MDQLVAATSPDLCREAGRIVREENGAAPPLRLVRQQESAPAELMGRRTAPTPADLRRQRSRTASPDEQAELLALSLPDGGADAVSAVDAMIDRRDGASIGILLTGIDHPAAHVRERIRPFHAVLWGRLRARGEAAALRVSSNLDARARAALATLALEHVTSDSGGERALALIIAGNAHGDRVIEPAAEALRDQSALVRETAARTMGVTALPAAVSPLSAALNDPMPGVRLEATFALSRIRHPSAIGPLFVALQDPDPAVRDVAAWHLGRREPSRVAEALAEDIERPGGGARAATIFRRADRWTRNALVREVRAGSPEIAEQLGDALQKAGLAERLPSEGDPAWIDPTATLRQLEALGAFPGISGIDDFLRALDDPDPEVRRIVALALLAHWGDPRPASRILQALAEDPAGEVATAAEATLDALERRPGFRRTEVS